MRGWRSPICLIPASCLFLPSVLCSPSSVLAQGLSQAWEDRSGRVLPWSQEASLLVGEDFLVLGDLRTHRKARLSTQVQRDFRWSKYIAQSLRLREGLQAKLLQQHSNNHCLSPQLTFLQPLPAEIGCSIYGDISECVFGKSSSLPHKT